MNGPNPAPPGTTSFHYPPVAQLRRLFDLSPDVLCVIGREGLFVSVSPSCQQMWGYAPEELIGKPFSELLLPADRPATDAVVAALLAGAVITAFENHYRHRDGRIVPLMWAGSLDGTDGHIYCIARDATEHQRLRQQETEHLARIRQEQEALIRRQRETEEELRRSNERFQLAARTDAIYDWDISSGQLHWGEGLHLLFGYQPEELQMAAWERSLHPDDRSRLVESLEATLADPAADAWEYSYQIRHSNGEWRHVFEKGFILRDDNGRAVRMVGRMQDVTAIRRTEVERRKWGSQLRGQQETMSAVLEQLRIGLITIGTDGHVSYWNSEAERITRWPRAAVVGKHFRDLAPGIDQSVFGDLYRRLLQQGGHVVQEVLSPYAQQWLEIQGYISSGRASFFFKDITSRKRYEDERQKLSLIARQTSNAVSLLDTDFTITWINPAYTHIYGFSFEEAVGRRPTQLIAGPDTDEALVQQFRDDMQAGREFRAEFVNYTKDGRRIITDITAQPVLSPEGQLLYYFVMARDITRRIEREAEFRKLSLITQQTDDGIIVTDADKRTTWVNDGFTRMTGYTLEEMRGHRPAHILQGPKPDHASLKWVDEQYARRKPFSLEVLNYKKDGTPFWSLLSIQPLFDEAGNVVEYFSIRKDITARKQLEQELERERQKTTAAVIAAQEKERSDVSQELHDNVNQVLTTVKLYQELCLSGIGNRDELTRRSMELLQDSISEIRSLSKRLSAPSLGKIRLQDSIRELTEAVAATGKLEVQLDTAPIADFEADSTLHLAIYRILQEQLTNILKHAAAHTAHISFTVAPGAFLVMQVTDDGVGFDTAARGSGSGLANIRSRAESLQGTISLASAPGEGCTLVVALPLQNH
ncbi:MAG: PAS domain S-box protein [Chitinophagaceae bacterium]|nr:MAG: PAS domain S-box protein [Chitinophagaceae bacterium]